MPAAHLDVRGLSAGYGRTHVLEDVSFSVPAGGRLSILGRNGMGKTTLVNSIIGVTRHIGGIIGLDGRNITGLRPDERAHAGIGWVPQERNIFRSLTVEENMTAVARPGRWTLAKIYELFPRLAERRVTVTFEGTLLQSSSTLDLLSSALGVRHLRIGRTITFYQ